jgi:hypothetical protein
MVPDISMTSYVQCSTCRTCDMGVEFRILIPLNYPIPKHDTPSPSAKLCDLCPLPAKAHSYTLATERHNVSRLGMNPKRVMNISHLDGYYPVSGNYGAFP